MLVSTSAPLSWHHVGARGMSRGAGPSHAQDALQASRAWPQGRAPLQVGGRGQDHRSWDGACVTAAWMAHEAPKSPLCGRAIESLPQPGVFWPGAANLGVGRLLISTC